MPGVTSPPTSRGRGRPRSAARDDAILTAAVDALRRHGYSRMSMEGVAAAAGVSKPTLYLRYGSKAELAAAAFARVRLGGVPAPTGDLRADLVAQLRHLRSSLDGLGMALVGVCLAEEDHLPDLIDELRARSLRPGRQLMRDALADAQERGDLPPDADLETAIEIAFGAYYARYIAGEPFDDGWDERIADATLRSLRAG
jgi:AcrR family transcriptional regulator